ncbi:DUF3237 domain-containing protein [Nevskia ramosa]|uniref:DUF3237 domain-containing protein n=1 Tax=Nevskia ramosa TaxID=64002 RepID=UPI0003B377A6|nr:DUF3237 domain-containing protein [Nevskia ramosa]
MTQSTLETRWLMTLQGSIPKPVVISPSLMIFNVLDATIDSPRLKAKILPPSGDWVQVQDNGNWKLDVRLLMEADDGCPIYAQYSGILRMDPGLGERLASGEEIPGSELYFRSAPYFQTPSEKYGWLNNVVAVGKMRSFGGGNVVYDIFEVL